MSKNTPKAIRGTQDIFGPEAEAFAFVVETFERVRKLYRFRRAEMPVFEKTEVFSRAIGETTDVVSKEDLSLAQKNDRLRRENRILKEEREILKTVPGRSPPVRGINSLCYTAREGQLPISYWWL